MDKYAKFILTVIAVGIIGINFHLFKDEIISPAYAVESHYHYDWEIWSFESEVQNIVEDCRVSGSRIRC